MNRTQDRIDFFLCRPIIGIPLFFLVIYALFTLSFSHIGGWLTRMMENFFFLLTEMLQNILLQAGAEEKLVFFCVGVCKNTAAVLSFLPQTAIFFFLLKGLEECGYLARAVFAMDTFFNRFGLSGNAAIPAIVGCGCSVSSISVSEKLDPQERKHLIFSVPFLICNARFPVLFFLAESFFPEHKALAAWFFYALSVFTFFISSLISSKGKSAPPLIVRLTDYKIPKLRMLFKEAKNKSKEFLNRTGTVFFLCSVGIHLIDWIFPQFFIAEEENLFSWIFSPLGFGKPPFTTALFTGFFAKENLMFILETFAKKELVSLLEFPARVSFTAFSMLYLPCFSAVCSVFREMGIQKTLIFTVRSFLFAYIESLSLYTLSGILVAFVKF